MITSKSNATVVAAAKLKDKKGRREQGKFLIEGRKLIRDAAARGVTFDRIFVTEDFSGDLPPCEVSCVSESVLKYISDTKTNQGAVGVAYLPEQAVYDGENALLLDRVQDPSNIGSLLRTACAAGYKNVFLVDCADVFSPKAIRCGMSGQFSLNFFEVSEESFLSEHGGEWIVCADMDGENVFEAACPEKHILVLGNEGQGVSENLMRAAKQKVKIPMQNNLESLNVAVSGGIIMYQLNRRQWR